MSPGSSPLTRGKPNLPGCRRPCPGLIPAHAGKTSRGSSRPVCPRAHPRSRGENPCEQCSPRSGTGSSPLTRGKRLRVLDAEGEFGLIPAHAGKTEAPPAVWQVGPAHPRSRGENIVLGDQPRRGPGSSPLTRGKHFLTCAFIAQIGQILESLELCASSESYSSPDAYATDALQGRVRSIGLAPRSSRGAS